MKKELKDYYSDTSGQNKRFFVQLNGAVSSAMSHLDVNNMTIKKVKLGQKEPKKTWIQLAQLCVMR